MSCNCEKNKVDDIICKNTEKREKLEAYIASLPINEDKEHNRGYLIQILHKAQEIFGFLPTSVQLFVADKLILHLSDVYGVVSFYSYFTDKPLGKYKINICTGTACFVRGSGRILEEFQRFLNISDGETSEDGKFSLGSLRCVGACSLAPVVMVNDKVYGEVTPERVAEIIAECK